MMDTRIEPDAPNDVIKESLCDLLGKVISTWDKKKLNIKPLSGGFVNSIWLCSIAEEQTPSNEPASQDEQPLTDGHTAEKDPDKVAVRIFRDNSLNPIGDRDFEFWIMTEMAKKRVCQPVYARFQNGFVYGYAEGRLLTSEDMKDPEILRMIFEKLHVLHAIGDNVSHGRDKTVAQGFLTLLHDKMPQSFEDPKIQHLYETKWMSRDEVLRETDLCRQILEDINTRYPPVVIHGDLWFNNMILDKSGKEVWIIDWEAASLGAAPLELAFILEDWLGPSPLPYEVKTQIIRAYLQHRPGHQDIDEDVMNTWYRDVIKAQLVTNLVHVMWALWGMTNAEDKDLMISLLEIATAKVKIYKKEVLSYQK